MKSANVTDFRRTAALALLIALLVSVCVPAPAKAADPADVDLMLAGSAVSAMSLTDAAGTLIQPHKAPELLGRGNPDVTGIEPDYRGTVGYVALQTGWEVSRFNTFTETPWMLPLYEQEGTKWKVVGAVAHKTPVLVTDQQIKEERGHKFGGHLQVIRLDTFEEAWIDVIHFVTAPYWSMNLTDAVGYGYCIAVYNNNSGIMPTDRKGNRGELQEGTRVLMCERRTARYVSPDKKNNPLPGIIFRSGEKKDSYYRTFLFFNANDLTLTY